MKKTILFYFNSMTPAGGIERVISKHIHFLSRKHEVILLTNDKNTSFYELPSTVEHHSLNVSMEFDMASRVKRVFQIVMHSFKIIGLLRNKKIELKADLFYVASPLTLFFCYLSQRSGKNIIVTEHSSYSAYNRIYKTIAKILYSKVGLLTVPTILDSNFYKSISIDNEYLPNPLPFYPIETSSLENKLILNVGRLTDDKQHLILLDIWSKTEAKNKDWKLKIIGKGENYNSIVQKIKELKLENSVILANPTKEIEKEYLNASIFVLTSRAEGFGLVLAEAMACGVPCISFDCPSGPKDIISNDKNGFLIEVNNNDLFTQKIDLLVENKNIRTQFGSCAKQDILKFGEEIISNKLNNLIETKFRNK